METVVKGTSMKAYTKEFISDSTMEILLEKRDELNEVINKKLIQFKNTKGEAIACPWGAFAPNGAIKVAREDNPVIWDLARRVQIRAEAERQHSGNAIASLNAKLQVKPNTLTCTVRCTGLSRVKCPTMDQVAECLSYLGNVKKIQTEIFEREEKLRSANLMAEDRASLKEMDDERKAVAQLEKERQEAARKAEQAVKDAFKQTQPVPEGNGEPVTAGV